MNYLQNVLVSTYAGGDFSWVETKADSEKVGDTLFTFLFAELSDDVVTLNTSEALRRLDTAIEDIERLKDSIERI